MVLLEDASFAGRWGRLPCCILFLYISKLFGLVCHSAGRHHPDVATQGPSPRENFSHVVYSYLFGLYHSRTGDLVSGRKGEMETGWEDANCSRGTVALVTVEMAKAVVVGMGGRDNESSGVLKTRNDELTTGRVSESY